MYQDYCLRFKDQAEAESVLFDEQPILSPPSEEVVMTKYLVKGTEEKDFEDYTTYDPPEGAEILDSWPEKTQRIDWNAPPQMMKVPRYAAIDTIGVIYKPTGNMIQTDDGEVEEMTPLDGWHVNVRHTEEVPEFQTYQVFPNTPSRGWA